MKKNFPHLAKEIDFQEVQEAQRVPKKLDPRRNTPRHIVITIVLNCASDRLAICWLLISGALICSFIWAFFCCLGTLVT